MPNTPIVDTEGNKLSQPRLGKRELSMKFRDLAKNGNCASKAPEPRSTKVCGGCGFKKRGTNHTDGAHHDGRVPLCGI